jgi:hypothetical protein
MWYLHEHEQSHGLLLALLKSPRSVLVTFEHLLRFVVSYQMLAAHRRNTMFVHGP